MRHRPLFAFLRHERLHPTLGQGGELRLQSSPFRAERNRLRIHMPKEKFRDVRVESGEELTLTLAIPLKVRLPKAQ